MEVTCIQCNNLITAHTITNIEVIGTYRITFQTDTKYFRLYTVFHILVFHFENAIQRILQ